MTKENLKKEIFLVSISFLLGGILMILLIRYTPIMSNIAKKTNTEIYEKQSLFPSIQKIYDAVVVVEGYSNNQNNSNGTGFIYKVDNDYGYILTNEHVISESENIKVILSTEEEITTEVLGKDEYLDLAVLRIDKSYVKLVAQIGNSETVNLGDTIFTVGSPLGYNYRGSVTAGVLSGKDRMVSVNAANKDDKDWVMKTLQIDASINPGNSGGPLLNINGEVIGICTMKLVNSDIEGMGFAIPIEYAMDYVNILEKEGKINWPTLGITMINVENKEKLAINNITIPSNIDKGVVILNVKEESVAETLGIKEGDIITKIGNHDVKDIAYLRYELFQYKLGDKISITYLHDGKDITKTTILK